MSARLIADKTGNLLWGLQLHDRDDDTTDNFGNARKQAALERITKGESFPRLCCRYVLG